MEETRVEINWREVPESCNTARLGEDWFQTGRSGSRDLCSGAGEGSSACSRDERSLVSKGEEAET